MYKVGFVSFRYFSFFVRFFVRSRKINLTDANLLHERTSRNCWIKICVETIRYFYFIAHNLSGLIKITIKHASDNLIRAKLVEMKKFKKFVVIDCRIVFD